MDLTLKDFQSWKDAEIKVEGLTVVVGPSNRGKSAFIRALRGVLRNEISERRIRKGTKATEVTATFDGNVIKARRTGGSKGEVTYQVGDQDYAKLGGKVPPPVEAMNFGKVTIGNHSLDPVFAGQFDGQFLLSSDPSEVTAALNAFAATDKLDAGRKVITTRTNEISAEAKALGSLISQAEVDFHEADTLVNDAAPLVEQVNTLSATVQRLQSAVNLLKTLVDLKQSLEVTRAQVAALTGTETALATATVTYKATLRSVRASAASTALKALRAQVLQVESLSEVLKTSRVAGGRAVAVITVIRTRNQRAKVLDQVEALALVTEALHGGSRIWKSLTACRTAQATQQDYARIQGQLSALDSLKQSLNTMLIRWKARVRVTAILALDVEGPRALAAQVGDLQSAINPPNRTLMALGIIRGLMSLRESHPDVESLDQEIKNVEAVQHSLGDQITQALKSAVTCPKCQFQFNPA